MPRQGTVRPKVSSHELQRRLGVCLGEGRGEGRPACEVVGEEGVEAGTVYCGECRTCNGGKGRMIDLRLTRTRCPLSKWE